MALNKLPMELINDYLWDLMIGEVDENKALPETLINIEDYAIGGSSIRPFFRVLEPSDVSGISPTFLYDSLFMPPNNTSWFIEKEQSTITIKSEINKIFEIERYLYNALKKFDVSAQELNSYLLSKYGQEFIDLGTSFKYIKCDQDYYEYNKQTTTLDPTQKYAYSTLILTYEYTSSS
jgi:hypothetical protein